MANTTKKAGNKQKTLKRIAKAAKIKVKTKIKGGAEVYYIR